MRSALPLAVVVLVCLAGCGSGIESEPRPELTATPGAVPTDHPLADPPAGLTHERITDFYALAGAHSDSLANTSFTIRTRRTVTAMNGTKLTDSTFVRKVSANRSYVLQQSHYESAVIERWYSGDTVITRSNRSGTVSFDRTSADGYPSAERPTMETRIRALYYRGSSPEVSSDGNVIQIRITTVPDESLGVRGNFINVTAQTVVLSLTRQGRVTQYSVEYEGTLLSEPNTVVTGHRFVQFDSIGNTTVERPNWAANDTTPTQKMSE